MIISPPPEGQQFRQNQPGSRCKMETVAVPEQRRSGIGITFRPVERFGPLEGDILGVHKNRRFLGKRSGKRAAEEYRKAVFRK